MELNLSIRSFLYSIIVCAFSASPAWAQCTGVFPANTLCGNLSGSPAPPSAFSASGSLIGPGSSTLNGLPLWANTLGTQLKDGAGLTVAGAYTWGGAQTYSSTDTFNGTANFTSAFQISGNTMTFPGSAQTIPGLGTANTWTANNNFTGGLQISGVTVTQNNQSTTGPTFQVFTTSGACTYTTPAGVKWIQIRMVGGGGGGGGVGATTGPTGGTGGNTTFGTSLLTANGGAGGAGSTGGSGTGGAGGTATLGGSQGWTQSGQVGQTASTAIGFAGAGGSTTFSPGTYLATGSTANAAGIANTGVGGSGVVNNGNSGGGGGGGSLGAVISNPIASYGCNVGAVGAGGIGTGTGAATGGAGQLGQIIVEEHYNY